MLKKRKKEMAAIMKFLSGRVCFMLLTCIPPLSSFQHSQEEGVRRQVSDETESTKCQVKVSDLISELSLRVLLKALSALMQRALKKQSDSCFPHTHFDIEHSATSARCMSGTLSDHAALPALTSTVALSRS